MIPALILLAVAWFQTGRIVGEEIKGERAASLKAIADGANSALEVWSREQAGIARWWAENPDLVAEVMELTKLEADRDALLAAPAQAQLRTTLRRYIKTVEYQGFFVVDPDGVSIASMRDENTGTPNLFAKEYPGVFARVLSGQAALTHPQESDVLLERDGKLTEFEPTMFALAPIRNPGGAVIAVFALRIDVRESFLELLGQLHLGATGELITFDTRGRVISRSVTAGSEEEPATGFERPSGSSGTGEPILDRLGYTQIVDWPNLRVGAINLDGYPGRRGELAVGVGVWNESLDIGIGVEMSSEEAFSALRASEAAINLFAIAVALLFIGIAIVINRYQNQVKAREELERRAHLDNARLAAILAESHDAIIGETLDGVVTAWNRGAERLSGQSSAEMLGQKLTSIFPPEFAERWPELMKRVKDRKPVMAVETSMERSGGEIAELSLTISPIENPENQVVGASIIARDITEMRKAERLVRLTVEAAPSGILMTDQHGRIVLVNSQLEKIFGYSKSELIGEPVEMLIPARKQGEHASHFAGYVESPLTRIMGAGRDLTGLTRAGLEVPIEIALTPLHTEEGLRVLAVVVDITERQRTYSDLANKTEEMEQMLYAVSHDLKSPLVTMSGFVGLLNLYVENGDRDGVEDATSRIQRGAATMMRLIDDLLELGWVGSRELDREPIELSELLDEVSGSLFASLSEAKASLHKESPLPDVFADRGQLVRVILNLVENSIKYGCPEPGAVISIGGVALPEETRIYVRDDGPGIEPMYHELIFKLFQRLSTDDLGTGTGLATVAKIMNRHGGRTWVESTKGAGACFWVAFPSRERALLSRRSPVEAVSSQSGETAN